ncbi:type IV secretion system protein [Bartonella jaculi]|uniref:TrwJ3 protein n=1 Tax=Bartonella jaculi TaxID=686226 RepID=A0ABP9N843_9HYPH
MRKLFIIIGVIAFIGILNSTRAFAWSEWNWGWHPKPKASQQKPSSEHEYLQIIDLLKKQLEVSQKQLKKAEEMHRSLTGTRTKSKEPGEDDGSFYFRNPQFIYDKDKQKDIFGNNKITGTDVISQEFNRIARSELYPQDSTTSAVRNMINRRKQYAEFMDKTVALQVFKEIENRFQQIANMLVTFDQMKDLKGVTELQMRMKGTLAMIQNETAKLHMIAHSRNIEQALISRLQRTRNVQILGSTNTQMPQIR